MAFPTASYWTKQGTSRVIIIVLSVLKTFYYSLATQQASAVDLYVGNRDIRNIRGVFIPKVLQFRSEY